MLPIWASLELLGLRVRIGAYGVCILVGIGVALGLAFRRARRAGLSPRSLATVFFWALVAAFAGARLAYPLQSGGPILRGGLVLYGGLLAGLAAAWLVCRRLRLPAVRVFDLAVPGVLLGVAFGRVGCFFAGCCYGVLADFGACYPPGSHAFRDQLRRGWIDASASASLPTVPAPLLEAVAAAAIAWVLLRSSGPPGRLTALAGLLYSSWRFLAETWRGDHEPFWGPALTFSQGISLAVFAAAARFLLRRSPAAEPPLPSWRPLSRGQVAALGALLAIFGATLACRVAPARPQLMEGEAVLAGGCDKERRVKAYREAKEEAADCACDCLQDCIADCMNDCIQDCLGCDEEEDAAPSGRPDPAPGAAKPETRKRAFVRRPPAFREMLSESFRARGLLGLEGTINDRFPVGLFLRGTIDVIEVPKRGPVVLFIRVEELSVTAGPHKASGTGEIELRVGEDLECVITKAKLPEPVLILLHSAAPLLAGYLRVDAPGAPDPAIRAAVEKEINEAGPGTRAVGSLILEGETRKLDASAEIVRLDSGDWRLKWKTYR